MILAVVVTYNRLELLKRNIASLRSNEELNGIIVVNNGSTDGTSAWLATQSDLDVVTQENVGGSGGFYSGIAHAMERGADWIWCMDDDVFPRHDCLKELLRESVDPKVGILAPRRLICVDGVERPFTNDFTEYDFSHTFGSMHKGKLSRHPNTGTMDIVGTDFEGPLIRSSVVESIGLPNRELFIFCDDTDYCLRAVRAGYRILSVPAARMDKHRFFTNDSWAEKQQKKKWKRFYHIRNTTYMYHHYGTGFGVRYLRGFLGLIGYVMIIALTAPFSKGYRYSDIPFLWRAYSDGIHEHLGKI